MVIYNHTVTNNGVFQSTTINGSAGTDLDIIADLNATDLMNLLIATGTIWCKAKAIGAND